MKLFKQKHPIHGTVLIQDTDVGRQIVLPYLFMEDIDEMIDEVSDEQSANDYGDRAIDRPDQE